MPKHTWDLAFKKYVLFTRMVYYIGNNTDLDKYKTSAASLFHKDPVIYIGPTGII